MCSESEQQLAASYAELSSVSCWFLWGHRCESLNALVQCAAPISCKELGRSSLDCSSYSCEGRRVAWLVVGIE